MAERGTDDAKRVRVDGEEAVLHITDQSVMFEKGGKVMGFERSAIRMVKPDADAMIVAYSASSEKSVRVEPMTVVSSLLVLDNSGSASGQARVSAKGLDEVFEKLYQDARKGLEEKLARVEEEARDKSLRLTPEEDNEYSQVSRQTEGIV